VLLFYAILLYLIGVVRSVYFAYGVFIYCPPLYSVNFGLAGGFNKT